MWIDIVDGSKRFPEAGDYLVAIGKQGKRNSAYLVLTSRRVKRRELRAYPRFQMDIEHVQQVPDGVNIFEFRWYPRRKRKKITFEDYIRRTI